jgi:hypothetical protein
MIFAALLLLSPIPLIGDAAFSVSSVSVSDSAAIAAPPASSPALLPRELLFTEISVPAASVELTVPSMPQPKPSILAESSAAEPAAAFAFEPAKPATHRELDNRNQRRVWYGLVAAGHAGAAFDAWTTRRALSGNWGREADPLMRPFAHSNAIYIATQVAPALMDYVGRRAMVSEHLWVRRLWWVPQSVGAGLSFRAAIHNYSVVH